MQRKVPVGSKADYRQDCSCSWPNERDLREGWRNIEFFIWKRGSSVNNKKLQYAQSIGRSSPALLFQEKKIKKKKGRFVSLALVATK